MSTINVVLAVVVAGGVFLVFQGLSRPQADILQSRLAQFGDHELTLDEMEMATPLADRVLRPLLDSIGGYVLRRTPAGRVQRIQEMINLAGRPRGMSVGSVLVLRFFLLPPLMCGIMWLVVQVTRVEAPLSYVLPLGGAYLGYMAPQALLSRKVRARQKELLLALPNALDLLTISVEAGLAFDSAMARVTEKYHNALALEFAQVLNEVRLGRSRLEAIEDMGRRNRVEELNGFCQAVVQSEQLGVGIANVLRIQSEEIRRKRRQRAEEQGQKAPLKMLFPMVGCIFPTLFVILLGPAAITVFKQFSGTH